MLEVSQQVSYKKFKWKTQILVELEFEKLFVKKVREIEVT